MKERKKDSHTHTHTRSTVFFNYTWLDGIAVKAIICNSTLRFFEDDTRHIFKCEKPMHVVIEDSCRSKKIGRTNGTAVFTRNRDDRQNYAVCIHVCVCEKIFQRVSYRSALAFVLFTAIETEATDVARHSPNCTYTRAFVYIRKVPYRYIQHRVPRPNGRKTCEYVRTIGIYVGSRYARGSMRVQVRKSTVAWWREKEEGETEKEREREEKEEAHSQK